MEGAEGIEPSFFMGKMKQQKLCDHPVVDQMGRMNFTGNVIPMNWYKTITRESGKPYHAAIAILSEIVYWYRPAEIRDEITGAFIGWKKKFQDEQYLQKTYKDLADTFGFSYQEVLRAVRHLESIGVITRIIKNKEIAATTLYNILYIDLHPSKLQELTYESPNLENEEAIRQDNGQNGSPCTKDGRYGDVKKEIAEVDGSENKGILKPSSDNTQTGGILPPKTERPSFIPEGALSPILERSSYPAPGDPPASNGGTLPSTMKGPSCQNWRDPPFKHEGTLPSALKGHIHRLLTENLDTKSSSSESKSNSVKNRSHRLKMTIKNTHNKKQDRGHHDTVVEEKLRKGYRERMKKQIEFDVLVHNYSRNKIEEIVELLVDILSCHCQEIRVNGVETNADIVKSRLLKLDSRHIEIVLESMYATTSRICNIRNYLLTALYNVTFTREHATFADYNYLRAKMDLASDGL